VTQSYFIVILHSASSSINYSGRKCKF